ncbi:MAG: hypothetical protein AABY88_05985 [Pseudomonadota bacterium]
MDIQLGYDVDRTWATGAQVFTNQNNVLIVFREQTGVTKLDGSLEMFIRNVGSVTMPTEVAVALRDALSVGIDGLTQNVAK